jgi:hypothetical protein
MAEKRRKAARAAVHADTHEESLSFFRWFWGNVFSLLRRHGGTVGFWIGIGYIAHQVSVTFMAFAGRESSANLAFGLMSNVTFVFTGSIALSGLSISLYWKERSQHRETRKRLARRITELELGIDPTRTSSRLTEEGLTREGDR